MSCFKQWEQYLAHSKYPRNARSHYDYQICRYWEDGGDKVDKCFHVLSNQRRNKRSCISARALGQSSLLWTLESACPYSHSCPSGQLDKHWAPLTCTQSLRTHRCQDPPGKPKLEKESVLILWTIQNHFSSHPPLDTTSKSTLAIQKLIKHILALLF